MENNKKEPVKRPAKPRTRKQTKPAPAKLRPTDLIYCASVFPGEILIEGRKSHNVYNWPEMGDVIEVEYQDLLAEIINKRSSLIYTPLIVIQSEQILSERPELKKLYSHLYSEEVVFKTLKEANQQKIKQMLNNLPEGMKENVRTIASTMIHNRSLDSMTAIRVLDKELGTDFETMISTL